MTREQASEFVACLQSAARMLVDLEEVASNERLASCNGRDLMEIGRVMGSLHAARTSLITADVIMRLLYQTDDLSEVPNA